MSLVAHQTVPYAGFCRMEELGGSLLVPGWDASPSQGYPRDPYSQLSGRLVVLKILQTTKTIQKVVQWMS